jgi:heme A synthase
MLALLHQAMAIVVLSIAVVHAENLSPRYVGAGSPESLPAV